MSEVKVVLRFEEVERSDGVAFGLMLVATRSGGEVRGVRLITSGIQLSVTRNDAGDMKLPMVELTLVCVLFE